MSTQEPKYPFEFTALPHVFTDFWMPLLSPTAIVTMTALYRATIGWQQIEAAVSFPKLSAMTGIASYDTLTQDLEELMIAGLIKRKGEKGKHRAIIYQLMESALTFTDFVKWLQEQMKDKTFTETVKPPLQNPKRPFFRNRKDAPSESVKAKDKGAKHQLKQQEPPHKSEREAKENVLKKGVKENDKEMAAAPRSPDGSPVGFEEGGEKEEEEQEEQPDLVTLRNDYAALSQQLAQLDVRKQAGQWARLYKQVKAAEACLRQAEQDISPFQNSPPECAKHQSEYAKQQAAPTSRRAAILPSAETAEADEQQAQLRAIASDLLYWKGGLKVLRQAQFPKWGYFTWQIEAKIEALQTAYAKVRAACAKPDR